jgi:hypothetical protein
MSKITREVIEPLKVPEFVYQERAKYDALMILDRSHYGCLLDVTDMFVWCSEHEVFVV